MYCKFMYSMYVCMYVVCVYFSVQAGVRGCECECVGVSVSVSARAWGVSVRMSVRISARVCLRFRA